MRFSEAERLDQEFAKRIQDEAMGGCNEEDHRVADHLLVELLQRLGFNETVKAWNAVGKWYA